MEKKHMTENKKTNVEQTTLLKDQTLKKLTLLKVLNQIFTSI